MSVSKLQQFPWLFSASADLAAFLGSAIVSLLLLGVGAFAGVLHSDSPEWTWATAVLLVDVAHVYATGFRVYTDRSEFNRRRGLYVLTPVVSFVVGWAVYSEFGSIIFWRVLAYLAVFHFVRQQYGWVALYRSREGDTERIGKWIDSAAIYLATVYPLVWWHSNLPREFGWFLDSGQDFAGLPQLAANLLASVYWLSLLAYAFRSLRRGLKAQSWNPGKDIVVLTTAVCWYAGIVTFNSDYAFTVTNVLIHGVPYFVLIYWYRERSASRASTVSSGRRKSILSRLVLFIGPLWLLAFAEELLWDRGVWHERSWLFGDFLDFSAARGVLVPLLVVPQLTHYILDGFIWRRRSNPGLEVTLDVTQMSCPSRLQ